MIKEICKKTGKVIKIVLLGITALVILWVIVSNMISMYEKQKYQPTGKMVTVDGKKIHVYEKGEGKHTILLMSGAGTAAPVMDFEPLINELSKNNKVVVVEPFGYGWSDITKTSRTVDNIVKEIRTALSEAGIQGPFILMPHSISGIYAIYFENTYPDEVEAIIGIDCTLPRMCDYFNESAPKMPSFMSLLAPSGIARLAVTIMPDQFLPIDENNIYSKNNLNITKAISSWKIYNKNVVDEANELSKNIEETFDMEFIASKPVLIFTREDNKKRADNKDSKKFYESYIDRVDKHKLVFLKGHHYLHWNNYKVIADYTNQFMD